jgi:alkylation response protein AidB-like acyl-CoA dehydrogenase
MVPSLTTDESNLVEIARTFAAEHITPYAADWELNRTVPVKTFREAARVGLTGVLVPKELGGRGASNIAAARVLEELAGACFAFTFSLWVHNNLLNAIARNGTPEQIARYVPAMLAGERIGAFCLTEPGAGSDAAAITTHAEESASGWRLSGEKAWVTNGTHADVFGVYAQTNPAQGWRGIASFLVSGDAPGLVREAAYTLLGGHAMGVTGLRLTDCLVPEADVLFGPGDGFKAAMRGITMARTFVGASCCGILTSSLKTALTYGAKRQAFGKPLLAFQGLQWELADVATDLEAARLLTYQAAAALDQGQEAIAEAAHAKKFASRVALTGVSQCMQAMGAEGLRTDTPLARHLATAKMTHYLDGATEIQNMVISRTLLKDYGIEV